MSIYREGYMVPIVDLTCQFKQSLSFGEEAIIETRYIPQQASRITSTDLVASSLAGITKSTFEGSELVSTIPNTGIPKRLDVYKRQLLFRSFIRILKIIWQQIYGILRRI